MEEKKVYLYILTNHTYSKRCHSKIGVSINVERRMQACINKYGTFFCVYRKYTMPDRETALRLEKEIYQAFKPLKDREYLIVPPEIVDSYFHYIMRLPPNA